MLVVAEGRRCICLEFDRFVRECCSSSSRPIADFMNSLPLSFESLDKIITAGAQESCWITVFDWLSGIRWLKGAGEVLKVLFLSRCLTPQNSLPVFSILSKQNCGWSLEFTPTQSNTVVLRRFSIQRDQELRTGHTISDSRTRSGLAPPLPQSTQRSEEDLFSQVYFFPSDGHGANKASSKFIRSFNLHVTVTGMYEWTKMHACANKRVQLTSEMPLSILYYIWFSE